MNSGTLVLAAAVSLALLLISGCEGGRSDGGPPILSVYKDLYGSGHHRALRTDGPHTGVDFGGDLGDPIIAAADGVARQHYWETCGIGARIYHPKLRKETLYCHLSEIILPTPDKYGVMKIKRGQPIGYIGMTGRTTVPHVHFGVYDFEKNDGAAAQEDPMPYIVGCYDPKKIYKPNELTYPLTCVAK